jgi:hypothetical protein
MVWSAVSQATGWQLAPFDADGWNTPIMRRLIPRIVESIDSGRPVLTVDRDLNSAVIYGHKQDQVTFVVRTYADPSLVCNVSDLGQDPALVVFIRQHREPPPRAKLLRTVLRDTINAWEHERWDTAVSENLRSGRAALQAWIAFYDRLDEMAQHVTAHKLLGHAIWNYRHLCLARQGAAAFLARAVESLSDAAYELDQARATYAQESDLLAALEDSSWGQMHELRQIFFEVCHTAINQAWLDTSIEAWDPATRQREQALLRQALELETTAVAWLQAALAKTAPYTVSR